MSTAIELLKTAYRDHNLDEPTTFSTTAEFPYNIAKDLINEVVSEFNRLGNFWFAKTKTQLTYSPSTYTYDLSSLDINPTRIEYIRRESSTSPGELIQYEYRSFQRRYRTSTVPSGMPSAFAIFNASLELNTSPDGDYSIYCYHFKDMPAITATTDSQSGGQILVPTEYEDLISRSCYFLLGYKIGKWSQEQAYQDLEMKAKPFLVASKSNAGLPQRLPAAF